MEKNCSKKKEEKKEVVDKELISLREELMENLQKVAAIQKEISEKKYLFGE